MYKNRMFDFHCHRFTDALLFILRAIVIPLLILLPGSTFAVTEEEVIDYLNSDPSFLLRHPDILEKTFRYEQLSREKKARAERAKVLMESEEIIDNFKQGPSSNRKKTIIAFMDYDCIPCRHDRLEHERTTQLAEKAEIIQIPLGIMSSTSAQAVRILLTLLAEDRHHASSFHMDMLKARLPLSYATITETALKNGVEIDELEARLGNARASDELIHIQDLAVALGVEGTPAYLSGCELIKGRAGLDMLIESWMDCVDAK